MKNKIVKVLENFGYLVAICISTMFVYWMVKFLYYIISSVYNVVVK